MCIAVVGGMKRLEPHYQTEAGRLGVEVRVFNTEGRDLAPRLRDVDAVVVFTNKTSHNARNLAVRTARKRGIPVRLCHACGVCALRECVRGFTEKNERCAGDVRDRPARIPP